MKLASDTTLILETKALAGKNQASGWDGVSGTYREQNNKWYVKRPVDKVEFFMELFAGAVINGLFEKGVLPPEERQSFITANLHYIGETPVLIQPFVPHQQACTIIGTATFSGSDRSAWFEIFNQRYPELVKGAFRGLSWPFMISLLLGDYSVHSGNIVLLSEFSSEQFKHYARLDWGAAFRLICATNADANVMNPAEYSEGLRGWASYLTKRYHENFIPIPGFFNKIADHADQLKINLFNNNMSELLQSVFDELSPNIQKIFSREDMRLVWKQMGIDISTEFSYQLPAILGQRIEERLQSLKALAPHGTNGHYESKTIRSGEDKTSEWDLMSDVDETPSSPLKTVPSNVSEDERFAHESSVTPEGSSEENIPELESPGSVASPVLATEPTTVPNAAPASENTEIPEESPHEPESPRSVASPAPVTVPTTVPNAAPALENTEIPEESPLEPESPGSVASPAPVTVPTTVPNAAPPSENPGSPEKNIRELKALINTMHTDLVTPLSQRVEARYKKAHTTLVSLENQLRQALTNYHQNKQTNDLSVSCNKAIKDVTQALSTCQEQTFLSRWSHFVYRLRSWLNNTFPRVYQKLYGAQKPMKPRAAEEVIWDNAVSQCTFLNPSGG